jgi:hypothetical protein
MNGESIADGSQTDTGMFKLGPFCPAPSPASGISAVSRLAVNVRIPASTIALFATKANATRLLKLIPHFTIQVRPGPAVFLCALPGKEAAGAPYSTVGLIV